MRHLLYEVTDRETLEMALMGIKVEASFYKPKTILLHCYFGDMDEQGGRVGPVDAFAAGELVKRLKAVLPEAQIVGLSTGGEICGASMLKPCILISAILFQSSWVEVLSFPDILSRENEGGERLFDELENREDIRGVEILFAGSGIDSAPIYERLKLCREGLSFFGGYAVEHGAVERGTVERGAVGSGVMGGSTVGGDSIRVSDCERDSTRQPAFLVTSAGVLCASMVAILYGGPDLHIDTGRTTGWKPLGRTFQVTEAQGRRLFTVDGIPAYDLYDRFLKFPEEKSFREYAMEFPLMLRKGKMKLLRHPRKKFDDSSILLDGQVSNGDDICLSYGAPIEIIRKINKRCEKIRAFEPEAVLLYSCQGRRSFWGDLIGWEMEPFQKLAETGGACLSWQIMRNNQTGRVLEHRLTLLSVAMREGGKTGRFIPEIAVDDEILKGRMSLVHRMSTLIESTMEELQKTNDALSDMNERLAKVNSELRRIAITDELTGLYNRREIERRIKDALERARAERKEIALVMLDIDFFKKVNDTYGHDVGDLVLKEVSAILRENTDEARDEAAGRWGGEEFFILLPDQGLDEALALAERIRHVVERYDFPEARHLTVSVGVTCANADSNYQSIFIEADRALYQAKKGGRNRVVCSCEGIGADL